MEQKVQSPNCPYPPMGVLFELLIAPVRWAVLEAAVALGMADILEETSDVDEIAKRAGIRTDPAGLVYFLDAMVALGLANKNRNAYSNTELAKHFLCTESPVFMGSLLTNMKPMQQKNLARIVEIVKNGPPEVPQTEVLQNEAKWERSVTHLAAYQRAGMGAICADLVEGLDCGPIGKILDLGGGPGLIGAEILRRFPGATGVLLDLPAIIRLAQKEIEKEGMADRISCISGDYNETDLGTGYDLIWASHNLYYAKDRIPFFKQGEGGPWGNRDLCLSARRVELRADRSGADCPDAALPGSGGTGFFLCQRGDQGLSRTGGIFTGDLKDGKYAGR